MSRLLDQAMELLRAGRRVDGETLLAEAIEVTAARPSFLGPLFGLDRGRSGAARTPAQAAALFDLGQYLVACGDSVRAIAAMRKASAMRPVDDESRRDRITYGMNLGEVLQSVGELENAESVLRENVADRRAFYGEASEGLAWGLEPLASVLLARGRREEAAVVAEQALEILSKAGSVRVASVLPLVGAIRASGDAAPPFVPHLDALPDELKLAVMNAALLRVRVARDSWAAAIAQEVIARCARLLAAGEQIASAWAELFRSAGAAGAHEVSVSAARAYVDLQDGRGEKRLVVQGLEGLAQALEAAGHLDGAAGAWAEAEGCARKLGDPLVIAHALRNRGLFLADAGKDGWRPLLEEALVTAEAVGPPRNKEEVVRARGALGVRLQHLGEMERARQLLAEGLALAEKVLHAADPDLFALRTHLEAVKAGKVCGCAPKGTVEQKHALEAAVTELARLSLPEGLLDRAELGVDDHWNVRLARKPREGELELVNRALQHALAELRERSKR